MKHDKPVGEVMTKHPRSVQVTPLADHRLHHLPVVDGERLVGIISTTDLLEFGFEPRDSHKDLDEYLNAHFSIPQIMRTELVTIPSHSTVHDAARALATGELHAVPVVAEDNKLVGIVTSTDIVSYLLSL
jgi:CBS domain-containing protein